MGNQPFPLTEASISRKHAVFRFDEQTKKMTLTDYNSTNGTWLLGNDGLFHRITQPTAVGPNTLVRVGATTTFHIKDLIKQTPKPKPKEEEPVAIGHLRNVYINYTRRRTELENSNSTLMLLRMSVLSVGGVLGTILITLLPSDFLGDATMGNIVKGLFTLLVMVVGFILVNIKGKNIVQQRLQNDKYFQTKYCCPKCGFHFGARLYENILAEGRCPNPSCKRKFVEK